MGLLLMNNYVEHIFMCLFAIFDEVSVQIFCLFFNIRFLLFLIAGFWGFLYNLKISALSETWFFSQFMLVFSSSLCFHRLKVFSASNFSFMNFTESFLTNPIHFSSIFYIYIYIYIYKVVSYGVGIMCMYEASLTVWYCRVVVKSWPTLCNLMG